MDVVMGNHRNVARLNVAHEVRYGNVAHEVRRYVASGFIPDVKPGFTPDVKVGPVPASIGENRWRRR